MPCSVRFTDTNKPEPLHANDTVLMIRFDGFVPDFTSDLSGGDRRIVSAGLQDAVDWSLADQPDVGAFVQRGYWVRVAAS